MIECTKLTHTIFKSPKISYDTMDMDDDKDSEYKFVNSIKDINVGDLILIEHCYCSNNSALLQNVILFCPEMFDNLYPRTCKWSEDTIRSQSDEIVSLCSKKVEKNCFSSDDKYLIGLDISNFNHSTTPNASVKCMFIDVEQDICCSIICVYAHQKINIDEEITINYGEQIESQYEMNIDYIGNIIKQYIGKKICGEIIRNHICTHHGLYLVNDMICQTDRFQKYFKDFVKEEYNESNIDKWLVDIRNKLDVFFSDLIHKYWTS